MKFSAYKRVTKFYHKGEPWMMIRKRWFDFPKEPGTIILLRFQQATTSSHCHNSSSVYLESWDSGVSRELIIRILNRQPLDRTQKLELLMHDRTLYPVVMSYLERRSK